MNKISGAVFIKNNSQGYCLFESLWTLLPALDEVVVMDLESEDGTYEFLREIALTNKKFRIVEGKFPEAKNASNFATLANDVIQQCTYDHVIYWQADEIWHPFLMRMMHDQFREGNYDLSFWRIQYKENWQKVKWFPHIVHRVGPKNDFHFATEGHGVNTDGMNSDRVMTAKLCSTYNGGYFLKWGEMGEEGIKPYVAEMIMDVSNTGGFIDNITSKRKAHGPFWNEDCSIEGEPCEKWYAREKNNPNWSKTTTPFNIPPIMTYHLGKSTYETRPDLINALKYR